ncbi:MAG: cell wall-binding repeat-containing protein [Actinobacteria bacterium]|nr:cell wall-binding repeat-containing protein [Actinomycetota bacterium]
MWGGNEHRRRAPRIAAAAFVLAILALPAFAGAAAAMEVSTFAGKAGVTGAANGDRLAARFTGPGGIVIDASGNKYIADTQNHVIRKIAADGTVSTFAGKVGAAGFANGKGGAARFSFPTDVAVDASGDLYVADYGNHTIRKITPAGNVTTLAGSPGVSGTADGTGLSARFNHPMGLDTVYSSGQTLVFVADYGNHTIRRVIAEGALQGFVGTVGGWPGEPGYTDGSGSINRLREPADVAADPTATELTMYVTDSGNHTIRKLYYFTPQFDWYVETIAGKALTPGSDDGTPGRLFRPWGIALEGPNGLIVTEIGNHTIRRVAKLNAPGSTLWNTESIAGGAPGQAGSADGHTSVARFNEPRGVAVHPSGAPYIADAVNNTIRRIAESPLFLPIVGPDRYETAIMVSKQTYPGTAPAVVLAKGDDFPDALAAAPLAYAYNGPVILTPSGGLTEAVRNELLRLKPKTVLFVGLPPAVRDQVETLLPGAMIKSFVGTDRYHTATLLAEELKTKKGSVPWVVLVPGDKYPDALSVAPLAAKKGWAILLTPQGGKLPDVTRKKIQDLGVTKALVVGTWVNPPASVTQVVRKVGTDRYHTSALVAAYGDSQGLSYGWIAVATGENYPDALVVGPYLAKRTGILLLTHPTTLPGPIRTELEVNRDWIGAVTFPGLPAGMVTTITGLLR